MHSSYSYYIKAIQGTFKSRATCKSCGDNTLPILPRQAQASEFLRPETEEQRSASVKQWSVTADVGRTLFVGTISHCLYEVSDQLI